MGRIGRQRCFMVSEDNLKLPTDLDGVNAAIMGRSTGNDVQNTLETQCAIIAERMGFLGIRHKIGKEALASQDAVRIFCESIVGAWWELHADRRISFFRIEWDPIFNSVRLRGDAFSESGFFVGTWKSMMSAVDVRERTLVYTWAGMGEDSTSLIGHGTGEMLFDQPGTANGVVIRGVGRFWYVSEAKLTTGVKAIRLKRITEDTIIETMTSCRHCDIQSLAARTVADWLPPSNATAAKPPEASCAMSPL